MMLFWPVKKGFIKLSTKYINPFTEYSIFPNKKNFSLIPVTAYWLNPNPVNFSRIIRIRVKINTIKN